MNVHYRKGSLLEYDGVYLAEGPWPAKAYFDALRQARKRDAGMYLDYGYTRPNVFSRGPYDQGLTAGTEAGHPMEAIEVAPAPQEATTPEGAPGPEEVLPSPDDAQQLNQPPGDTSSRIWPRTHEHQASYAPAEVAANVGIGAGVQFQRAG
jgi:hypothetical protein